MTENNKYIGENKPYLVWSIFALVVIFALGYFVNSLSKTKPSSKMVVPTPTVSATITSKPIVDESKKEETMQEFKIEDIKVGTGLEAVAGKRVTVNYKGTLTDGTKFDSSYDRGTPFTFNLGAGEVIKGWDQGVVGMKIGGKRKLTIPSELGYGSRGAGAVIPPDATLIFEVELLEVK